MRTRCVIESNRLREDLSNLIYGLDVYKRQVATQPTGMCLPLPSTGVFEFHGAD